jgi:exo-1,4-beta-D-glucosaminidase
MDQGGSYFGAREANKPLHVQYSYDNKQVVVINKTNNAANSLGVKVDVFNIDRTSKFSQTATVGSVTGGDNKTVALTVPAISGLSSTHLARLILTDSSGREIDRNVYRLSTKADVMDFNNNDWCSVPTTAYADVSGLLVHAALGGDRDVRLAVQRRYHDFHGDAAQHRRRPGAGVLRRRAPGRRRE